MILEKMMILEEIEILCDPDPRQKSLAFWAGEQKQNLSGGEVGHGLRSIADKRMVETKTFCSWGRGRRPVLSPRSYMDTNQQSETTEEGQKTLSCTRLMADIRDSLAARKFHSWGRNAKKVPILRLKNSLPKAVVDHYHRTPFTLLQKWVYFE